MRQTLIVNGKSARLFSHCQMPYREDILDLPSFALMKLTFVSFTGTPEEVTFQLGIFQRCATWKRSKASLLMPARKVKVTIWPMGVLCNSIGLCHAILQCVWCKRKAVCGHSMCSICLEIYSSTGVNMNSEHSDKNKQQQLEERWVMTTFVSALEKRYGQNLFVFISIRIKCRLVIFRTAIMLSVNELCSCDKSEGFACNFYFVSSPLRFTQLFTVTISHFQGSNLYAHSPILIVTSITMAMEPEYKNRHYAWIGGWRKRSQMWKPVRISH